MRLGKMRERLTLERETRVNNGQGGYDLSWLPVRKLWAEVYGLSGDEAITAGVERNVTRWRVTIRSGDVKAEDRLIWNALKLDIISVMPHPQERGFMLMLCESGAAF